METETDSGWLPIEGATEIDWQALAELPFDEWESSPRPPSFEDWIQKAIQFEWKVDDEHFNQPLFTHAIARFLRLVAAKCNYDSVLFEREKTILEQSLASSREAEETVRARLELLRRENSQLETKLRQEERQVDSNLSAQQRFTNKELRELKQAKEELAKLTRELDRVRQDNSELRQALQSRNAEKTQFAKDDEKFRLEYKHLVARHKRLMEKSEKASEMLRELQRSEHTRKHHEEDELHRLRLKLRTLQQENYDLIQSRDRAEELCERREAEALRDMTELQQLHRDIVDEERQRVQSLKEDMQRTRQEAERQLEDSINELRQKLKQSEEEKKVLERKIEHNVGSRRHLSDEGDTESYDTVTHTSSSLAESNSFWGKASPRTKLESDNHTIQRLAAEQHRLQRENDRLSAELQQMEVRAEARDVENNKVNRLLKEYEHGDEGLRRLRGELADSNRSIELLQDENAQLRERLNAMEDSLTFSAALQELCLRIGVTQDEIDRLRPKSSSLLSEVETLRAEVATLKEEVDWLEKERRHWMDKVRLQPLLDTKLRLELGLTSEQLKQLDFLVDQMKSGRLVLEEDDDNYKEKFFRELQLRRKEMEHFNDFVKHRIEEALREAFGHGDFTSSSDAASAINTLRERVALISVRPTLDEHLSEPGDAIHLSEQLRSALQLLEQSELTIKDNAVSMASLREQLAALGAERDALAAERDRYRTIVLEALGVGDSGEQPGTLAATGAAGEGGGAAVTVASAPAQSEVESVETSSQAPGPPHSARTLVLRGATTSVNSVGAPRPSPFYSISRTLEEQLRVKDELIASFKKALETSQEEVTRRRRAENAATEKVSEARAQQEDLHNQVEALQEINEELNGRLAEQRKTVDDLQDAIRHIDDGSTRELLQKIVLLRQRENKLLQRLRRVRESQDESTKSCQEMKNYLNTTFASLKEALENTSTGFVLPRSSSSTCAENDVLGELQQRFDTLLRGRLFRDDSAYLLHLQQVYHGLEDSEELIALRAEVKAQRVAASQAAMTAEERRIELEQLKSTLHSGNTTTATATAAANAAAVRIAEGGSDSGAGGVVSTTRWETEAATWQQRCALYVRRCEDREREVSELESQLDDARSQLADIHRRMHEANLCSPQEVNEAEFSVHGTVENGNRLRQLEREVARLKSVNLGLLHYAMDRQGDCRGAEIQLEAARQELQLIRDSGDTRRVSDFVAAAIRQHAALRRQSELALLRAKRARVQLCASEANLRVAVNEATAYKLSAFRLYRRYVEQMVLLVDYVRAVQRGTAGALSPHRAALMHQRFLGAVTEAERIHTRNRELVAQLADSNATVAMMQQQLDLLRTPDGDRDDAIHKRLMSALAAARTRDACLAELKEDKQYMQQKQRRAEQHMTRLEEEVARLELGATGVATLDAGLLKGLEELRASVFAKAESPAIVIQQSTTPSTGANTKTGIGVEYGLDDPSGDVAVAEYSRALDRQAELRRECESLKTRVADAQLETRKAQAAADTVSEELKRAQALFQETQRQLEAEKRRAEEKERRLVAAHEAQSAVLNRAGEHNSQCLRDLIQQKEKAVQLAQEQLQAERRKFLEYQLEESSRMERLHDHLFRENNAMVERFREAISGVAERLPVTDDEGRAPTATHGEDAASQQLTFLTRETLRLKTELREARATNILLENQLHEQVERAQPAAAAAAAGGDGGSAADIMREQGILIESLRQREFSLSRELERCSGERDALIRQLQDAHVATVEQTGLLHSVAASAANGGSDGAMVQELRAQLAFVSSQLAETRAQLEEERHAAKRLHDDAGEWHTHLDTLRAQVTAQEADVARAKELAGRNASLSEDMQRVREQNERLTAATQMLKTRLVEEAHKRGNEARREQHEVALAQRMSAMQVESAEQMRGLAARLQTMQRDLQEKVRREEEALRKHGEAQQMAYDLHQQLREKEREIAQLRRERPVPTRREKGTQMLQTVSPVRHSSPKSPTTGSTQEVVPSTQPTQNAKRIPTSEPRTASPLHISNIRTLLTDVDARALAQPQIAAIVRREVERAQRDNLHEISTLRATVRRLEDDAKEAQTQLRGEREVCRGLRTQLHAAQRSMETAKDQSIMSKPQPQPMQELQQQQQQQQKSASQLPTLRPSSSTALPSLSARQPEESAQLRRQLERLKRRVAAFDDVAAEAERYKKELADLRAKQSTAAEKLDPAHMATPLDIRTHNRIVLQLESTIEALQRELHIEKAAQIRQLQQRVSELESEPNRVAATVTNISADRRALLEKELLERNGTIVDLRFEREALELRASRLQRHIDEIMQVDSTNTKRTGTFMQRGRVEALETVVENLRLVVERLQHENAELRSKSVSMSKHMEITRELREARSREQQLHEQVEQLTRRLVGSAAGGSAMSEQQARLHRRLQAAQASAEQYQTELIELRRKLHEPEQMHHGPAPEDRRAVRPIEVWEDAPPPLPAAPGLGTSHYSE